MMNMKRTQSGFTLIELMITVAIVGILAAVAIPNFANYRNRAQFTEVVSAATAYKNAVALCLINTNGAGPCNEGDNGVPAYTDNPNDIVTALALTDAGQITTTTDQIDGAATTFQLTPTFANGVVTWATGGSCAAKGWC